jgi:hypothetical protein
MALPRGWCGLPEVPGVPDAGLEALRALLSGADGDAVAKEVVSTLRAAALEEGDADELDASSMRALFADDEVVEEILAVFEPDILPLCMSRGVGRRSLSDVLLLPRVHEGAGAVLDDAVARRARRRRACRGETQAGPG